MCKPRRILLAISRHKACVLATQPANSPVDVGQNVTGEQQNLADINNPRDFQWGGNTTSIFRVALDGLKGRWFVDRAGQRKVSHGQKFASAMGPG
jgi:hypothetical protein